MVVEEWKLNLLAIELGGLRVEANVAQLLSGAPSPHTVRPRTHDQVIGDRWVLLLDRTKDLQWSHRVLGIEPPADGQHRGWHMMEVP